MTKKEALKNIYDLSKAKTQREFAEKTKMPFQKINAWINGRETLTDAKLKEIASKFGYVVSVEYKVLKFQFKTDFTDTKQKLN